jgi:DNA polymerase-3 subunit epsilon
MSGNTIPPLARETTFLVVDFETVTPKGRPPEPLELAAMRLLPGLVVDPAFQFSRLIRPPDDAPLTTFDTRQTGIREQDIADAPDAATILRHFDTCLGQELPILVAHNARYEAAIFQRFEACCPQAAALSFLDTVALGKHLVPGLANYKLDTLAQHFHLALPANRHRALPDVELTIQILSHFLSGYLEKVPQATVVELLRIGGIKPPPAPEEPIQISFW